MVGTLSLIQFLVKLRFSWIIYQHQHHRDLHFSGCFISYRAPHKGIGWVTKAQPNTACMYHDIPSFLTWRVFLIFCLSLPAAQCWCLLHPLHPLKKQNVSFFLRWNLFHLPQESKRNIKRRSDWQKANETNDFRQVSVEFVSNWGKRLLFSFTMERASFYHPYDFVKIGATNRQR